MISLSGADAAPGPDVAESMAAAANNFLASLDDDQRKAARFEVKDEERKNWHFIPKERNGLPLKRMDTTQRNLAFALLNSGMSNSGYAKALTIMTLEQILWELENHSPKRDPEMYHVSIFGEPGSNATWGWRVEGHHLSVNFTIAEGKQISGTPSFFATNPAKVIEGPRKGLRVLAREEDLARELVKSFKPKQREAIIIAAEAPRDILTSAERKVSPLDATGITYAAMNDAQRKLLWQLIREYVTRHRSELAQADLAKIEKAGLDGIQFAWAGGVEPREGHYYRVQGPTFLLEYANTQNDANHVHAVWRDFENDFGDDILRRHFEESHGK